MKSTDFSVFSWVNKSPLSCHLPYMAVGGGGWPPYLIWIISAKGSKDSRGQSYHSRGLLVIRCQTGTAHHTETEIQIIKYTHCTGIFVFNLFHKTCWPQTTVDIGQIACAGYTSSRSLMASAL